MSNSQKCFPTKRFTLDRRKARDIENLFYAETLSEWLSIETDMEITGENLCSIIEDGVVLCKLAEKYGHVIRYWNPPTNEFQRRENLTLFGLACSRLNCQTIPSKKGLVLNEVIPCLLDLAKFAKKSRRTMSNVVSSIPEDLNEKIDGCENTKIGEAELIVEPLDSFQVNIQGETMNLTLVSSTLPYVTWKGSLVLLNDILFFQKSKFLNENHQVLCLGTSTSICGLWASVAGSDVVLTDMEASIDLVSKNVSVNSTLIRSMGGSCGVRSLEFQNCENDMQIVMKELKSTSELTVFCSDKDFDCAQLEKLISAVNSIRKDAEFYLVSQHKHALMDVFQGLKGSVKFTQIFGDMEYRIFKGEDDHNIIQVT